MKRFLSFFISFMFLSSLSLPALAQKAVAPFRLHPVYEAPINALLRSMKADTPENTYKLVDQEFRKLTPLKDFKSLIELSQIKNTVGKKWLSRSQEGKKVTATGVFSYADGNEVTMSFVLGLGGKTWKVTGWNINLTPEMVMQSFPQGKDLESFLGTEIAEFNKGIQDKRASARYFYRMSTAMKNTIPFGDFAKALSDFKADNRNATLKDSGDITIREGFPVLQGTQMVVEGNYPNETHQVSFRFIYGYESGWKLNSFTIAPKTAEEIAVAEEAARKEAEEKALRQEKRKALVAEKRASRRKAVKEGTASIIQPGETEEGTK